MHNGFVQIDGEKMSKSLGNSFFLKDALKLYDGEVLRYYLNAVHYRNDFSFSEEELQLNKKSLDKLYGLKKRVSAGNASLPHKKFRQSLLDAMGDDLNISISLSLIDELIASTNDALDENPKDKGLKKETLANIAFIDVLLGFGGKEPFSYFQIGVDEVLKTQIETLVAERVKAKKEKDFARSDALRDELTALGINIMDTAEGTLWEKA
jgi:cysteinyl-tRNA synthetase